MAGKKRIPWYVGGLHFGCQGCGGCCSGPGEGYIWVTRAEVDLIADFLEISAGHLRHDYMKRVGLRTTIVEHDVTKDCIFLRQDEGEKKCVVYSVRPSQCRSWPFWPSNLANAGAWNRAGRKCEGINRGESYTYEEIERIKKDKKWWEKGK